MSVKLTDLLLRLGGRLPLNMGERAVLLAACFRSDDDGACAHSQADIAEQLGSNRATVCRVMNRLLAGRFVEKVRGGRFRVCVARLEAYLPGPVMSGRTYAGEVDCREDLLTGSQQVLTRGQQAELTRSQQMLTGSQLGENGCVDSQSTAVLTRSQQFVDSQSTLLKTDSKDTLGAGARACMREEEAEGLRAFLEAYPEGKPPRDADVMASVWHEVIVERGIGRDALMAALEEAKASRSWQEQRGRFVPRPERWLGEGGYMAYLPARATESPAKRAERVARDVDAQMARLASYGHGSGLLARVRAMVLPLAMNGMRAEDAVYKVWDELNERSE